MCNTFVPQQLRLFYPPTPNLQNGTQSKMKAAGKAKSKQHIKSKACLCWPVIPIMKNNSQ